MVRTTIYGLVLAVLGTAYGSAAGSPPLVLVEQGQPRAVLVVEADQPKAQAAAEALQRYLERMSGAVLPIVPEPAEGAAPVEAGWARVLVGHTRAAQQMEVQIPHGYDTTVRDDYGNEEGYRLLTRAGALIVAGNNDGPYQGTLYAAYALLERLGCRFYFPGRWGEVVPQQATIAVAPLDVTSRPDFSVRQVWLSGWVPVSKSEAAEYAQWCAQVGLGGDTLYPVAGDGFLAMLLPPDEFAADHPEFYAQRTDGTRRLPTQRTTGAVQIRSTMLCLSNPQVLEQSIRNIRAALAGQRTLRNVSDLGVGISPPDGAPFCYCPDCVKLNQNFYYPAYVQERMTSEEFFGFAAQLARAFPDKFIATMAYSNREVPPQGIADFPRNIAVKHATISCDVLHPLDSPLWRRQQMRSLLQQWLRLTPHVVVRDYMPGMLMGLYIPERDVANMAVNVPIYKALGVRGMVREGRKVFMQTWISYYVTARLLWDAHADVEAIKRDFYHTFFGADAGPHVQAWWDEYEQVLGAEHTQIHEDWLLSHLIRPALLRRLDVHVQRARAAAMDDTQRQRLGAFLLIVEHLDACARMLEAERELRYADAAEAAQAMFEARRKLIDIDSFFISIHPRRDNHPEMIGGRLAKFQELTAMTDGRQGAMLAPLPLEMRFARDPHNQGVLMEWYAPDHPDGDWQTRNTYELWDQQEPLEDPQGHDYNGHAWYRGEVNLPAAAATRPVRLWCGGAINEAWVWINGQYAGHKPFKLWWGRNQEIDLEVTHLIRPGQVNTIAIRVWNEADVGGLFRRGFFWSPNETPGSPAAPAQPAPAAEP